MSTEYKPSSSRRPRRSRQRRSSGRPGSQSQPRQTKAQPKSLWQKIAAFFAGKPEAESAHTPGSEPQAPKRERKNEERKTRSNPPIVEVTTPRLYVGNLSFDAVEGDLQELFSGVGSVVQVEIVINRHTQRSKGFAFVQMQTIEEAKRAVEELHDKEYMGRKLLVSGAKEERQHSEQPEQ